MAIILKLPLCLYELQGLVVCVDDCFLPQKCNASIIDQLAQWNTFICHKWDTCELCQTMSHCDMPLDFPVE